MGNAQRPGEGSGGTSSQSGGSGIMARRESGVLLGVAIACSALWLWPRWTDSPAPAGGRVITTQLGLPFSPWLVATQEWTQGSIALDYRGEIQIVA